RIGSAPTLRRTFASWQTESTSTSSRASSAGWFGGYGRDQSNSSPRWPRGQRGEPGRRAPPVETPARSSECVVPSLLLRSADRQISEPIEDRGDVALVKIEPTIDRRLGQA